VKPGGLDDETAEKFLKLFPQGGFTKVNVYTSLDDDTQSFYNKTLLVRALPNLLHD